MSPARQSHALPLIAALVCLVIAGCAVGPDFKRPQPPDVGDYTARPLSAGADQHFAKGIDISADWWTLFHSKPLDDLIEESLANNHDLKAAQAALLVARENVLAQRGSYYPSVTGGLSAARHQDPPGSLAPVPSTNASLYNLYTAQVSVSYVPDVFGL